MKKSNSILAVMAALSIAPSLVAQSASAPDKPTLTLTTTAFDDGGIIPNKYTAAATADPVSPPLAWSHVPEGTLSFVLILSDPDVAAHHRTDPVLHWVLFDIPGTTRALPEGVPGQLQLPDGSMQLPNFRHGIGYVAMGAGPAGPYHHYTFALYALDTRLTLGSQPAAADVENAMQGHILDKGVLVGRFHRP